MSVAPPPFTEDDAHRAYDGWGANCGPGALAAIMMMTLDDVRPHLSGFDAKRYTNPTMMNEALRSIGRPWRKIGAEWPEYGLVRIQWEGPWTEPGVPNLWRYRHTHWVGSSIEPTRHGIFDINAMSNGSGWLTLADWGTLLVPWILENMVPRASGGWHVTHGLEIEPNPSPPDLERKGEMG